MNNRNAQVSVARLTAAIVLVVGLLGAGPRPDFPDAVDHPGPAPADLDYSMGECGVVRDLRFGMLPADAEPQRLPSRHAPVCLAVYRRDR